MPWPGMLTRRDILVGACAATATMAGTSLLKSKPMQPKGIRKLTLHTHLLPELRSFYADVLGFPLLRAVGKECTVGIGDAELTFRDVQRGADRPFYHFAFNITESKHEAALEWLRKRIQVVKNGDGYLYHFSNWNAHAMYFIDPAGNIGEFIARHDMKHAGRGSFSLADVLGISEIGVVVDDVPAAVAKSKAGLGLEPYKGTNSQGFAAVGDEHALLILVEKGRIWLPATLNKPAVVHELSVVLGGKLGRIAIPGHPYSISGK